MKKKVLNIIFLLIIDLLIVVATYIRINFPTTGIDETIFLMNYGLSSADFTPLFDGIRICHPYIIILFVGLYFLYNKTKLKEYRKYSRVVLIIITILVVLLDFRIFSYTYYKFKESKFIEENYVDPKFVDVTFKKKKNLVLIYLESFETTMMDKKSGGAWNKNLLPELTKYNKKKNVTYFNTKDNKYGMKMLDTASYTTAALIAQSSAIPFKYEMFYKYNEDQFLNGAYTIGDLLKDNGYHNELISAATTSFGGINEFFSIHGDYEIIDVNNIEEYGYEITKSDILAWGFNDGYLFDTAKKRLKVLSKKKEPFNLTLTGIDTHFPKGYPSDYTVDKYDDQYENVFRTESIILSDFLTWLSKQDFYKDTVVVVVGDHQSMQVDFFKDVDDSDRYVYATYINAVKNKNKKNRIYTALDTYPTILGAMGAKIDGNRLGLGTNMFSNEKTLAEEYGFDKLNIELKKSSSYYKKNIIIK